MGRGASALALSRILAKDPALWKPLQAKGTGTLRPTSLEQVARTDTGTQTQTDSAQQLTLLCFFLLENLFCPQSPAVNPFHCCFFVSISFFLAVPLVLFFCLFFKGKDTRLEAPKVTQQRLSSPQAQRGSDGVAGEGDECTCEGGHGPLPPPFGMVWNPEPCL